MSNLAKNQKKEKKTYDDEMLDLFFEKDISKKQKDSKNTKLKNESLKIKKRFEDLSAKIDSDQKIINNLLEENRRLKEQIAFYENKIKSFPKIQKQYEELSELMQASFDFKYDE